MLQFYPFPTKNSTHCSLTLTPKSKPVIKHLTRYTYSEWQAPLSLADIKLASRPATIYYDECSCHCEYITPRRVPMIPFRWTPVSVNCASLLHLNLICIGVKVQHNRKFECNSRLTSGNFV
jgi:hypothetical protein